MGFSTVPRTDWFNNTLKNMQHETITFELHSMHSEVTVKLEKISFGITNGQDNTVTKVGHSF